MSTEHVERLRLRHRPDDLFELVSGVQAYPDFIGPITAMRVRENRFEGDARRLVAEARIRFKFVRERFVTEVVSHRAERRIEVGFLEGPFHDLANHWRFVELSDGSTLVDFWIRYHFDNPLLQMLLDANRARAVRYLVSAFAAEADRRYDTMGAVELDLTAEPAFARGA
ncbi:MAG: type II toxin-antitoxin system RatA family toxin [Pseudomonadota bacterium]